jgi:uncharacterized protein involved in exopolysaccharide biosynthesis
MKQALQDWRISKRKAITGFFRREWPVIAFILCFGAIAVGIVQVNNFQDQLRDSAVAGCERQNEVREAVRDQLTDEIKESQRVDYSTLFPNIPRAQLNALIKESNERTRERRAAIPDADCQAAYPET